MRRMRAMAWILVFSAAGALDGSPLPAQQTAAGRPWIVDTATDKMDGTKTYWLARGAKDSLVGALGAHLPTLQIYCSSRENTPYLQIAIEQLVMGKLGTGTVDVRVRQDSASPTAESWYIGDDASTIFPDGRDAAQRISRIKRLAEGQEYLVEVPLEAAVDVRSAIQANAKPSAGPRVLEFDVSGLVALLAGMGRGCGWKM